MIVLDSLPLHGGVPGQGRYSPGQQSEDGVKDFPVAQSMFSSQHVAPTPFPLSNGNGCDLGHTPPRRIPARRNAMKLILITFAIILTQKYYLE